MREDRVKLFNPLPSHSSPLLLSLPPSSLSHILLGSLGLELGFLEETWGSSSSTLPPPQGKFMILNLLPLICILMLKCEIKISFFI